MDTNSSQTAITSTRRPKRFASSTKSVYQPRPAQGKSGVPDGTLDWEPLMAAVWDMLKGLFGTRTGFLILFLIALVLTALFWWP